MAINFYYDTWPYSQAVLLAFEQAVADDTFKDIHFAKVNFEKQEVELFNIPLRCRSNTLPGHRQLAGSRGHGEYFLDSKSTQEYLKIYGLRKSDFSPTEKERLSSLKLP